MCGTVLEQGAGIRIRKRRRCLGCATYFPIGTLMSHVAMVDMGSVDHAYYCSFCNLYWSENTGMDDCISEGDLDNWYPEDLDKIIFQEGLSNPWPLDPYKIEKRK